MKSGTIARIEQLEKQEADLMIKLSKNRNEQRKIHVECWCEKYGVKLGDEVFFIDGRETIHGTLDHFTFNQTCLVDYAWVVVHLANGKNGKKIRRIWNSNLETMKKL